MVVLNEKLAAIGHGENYFFQLFPQRGQIVFGLGGDAGVDCFVDKALGFQHFEASS